MGYHESDILHTSMLAAGNPIDTPVIFISIGLEMLTRHDIFLYPDEPAAQPPIVNVERFAEVSAAGQ
jgi:hypothetical protein